MLYLSHYTHYSESEDYVESTIDHYQEATNEEINDEHEIAFRMAQKYGEWPHALECAYSQNETVNRSIQGL